MSRFGHTVMDSPLGKLLIAEEEGYISKILFINDGDTLPADQPTPLTQIAVRQLNEYFTGTRLSFDFPIRQLGTDFQQRVWNELLRISTGKTLSYLDLARKLGDEKSIRAAASANGKNNLAIVVPCHRVIGADGKLVGYAGGLWRKKWLLEHEARMAGKSVQTSLF